MTSTATQVVAPTGYASTITLFASRYKQGGRTVYSMDLSPEQIIATVPKPDPDVPSPGNRSIRSAHADSFAKYLREHDEWVSPSIMLRTPSTFDFEVQTEIAGIQFGILSIPKRSMGDLHIVDGQHRILGMFRAADAIAADIDRARSNEANARRNEGEGSLADKDADKRIKELEHQRTRLDQERVNVQIFVEADQKAYRQIFYDVADNALGITASVRVRFDTRKVVNRALPLVMDVHPLLKGRVDREGDRMGKGSPYMMGAKHVAEVIRSVNVGLEGRVSRRQEESLQEKGLADRTNQFFDTMVNAFPAMHALENAQTTASDVRASSLLGSVLFVRVLAGAYRDLLDKHDWERPMVEAFFKKLAPHVSAPVYEGSIWSTHLPELFDNGAFAPHSRRQDLQAFNEAVVAWAIDKPKFLDAKPAPRPVAPVEEVSSEDEMRRVDALIAGSKL